MKITEKQRESLTKEITIEIEKEDYLPKKREILKEQAKKSEIKGFRKGKVPPSIIEKFYGKSALLDAVNSVVGEALNNHIVENSINIIGEPLPIEPESAIDWDSEEGEFSFSFEIAPAPQIELQLDEKRTLPYHKVKITKKGKEEYIKNIRKQMGSMKEEEKAGADSLLIADLTQPDRVVEGAYISLSSIEEGELRDQFIGKKVGDSWEIDVERTFTNESDRAALLKVKTEELGEITPLFTIVIKEIKKFVDAAVDQSLFDKVFGEGEISSKEEFELRVEERMANEYKEESEYKFLVDSREELIEWADVAIPEEFLKRWLYEANEGKFSIEEIEKEFHLFAKDFRWQLITQHLIKEGKLELPKDALLEYAKKMASYQFAMYGLNSVPQEHLTQYAQSLLSDQKEGRKIYEKVEEQMVIDYVKGKVTLQEKEITIEKLRDSVKQ
ncbi:MAG: trigger factor [Bacteroidales bacterium]